MNRPQLTAAKYAARHSRIAHLLRITCAYCHAPAGEPCRSNSGTPIWAIGQMHDARLTAPRRQPATANSPCETGLASLGISSPAARAIPNLPARALLIAPAPDAASPRKAI